MRYYKTKFCLSPRLFTNKFTIYEENSSSPKKTVIFCKKRIQNINTKYVFNQSIKLQGVTMKKPDLNDSKKRLTFREIFDLVQKHEEMNRRNTKNKGGE